MTEQIKEQGGVATMDPGRLKRWLTSRVMTRAADPARFAKNRTQAEKARVREQAPHRVEYFHQPEDGYSHLAAQLLQRLSARYEIELDCHLVAGPRGKNVPEPELLLPLSRYDAFQVAPEYGLSFPEHAAAPDAAGNDLHLEADAFGHAGDVGDDPHLTPGCLQGIQGFQGLVQRGRVEAPEPLIDEQGFHAGLPGGER